MSLSYKPRKIVVASGYFNPIHCGHIEYLQKSRELGDQLIVIVNNDKQVIQKKGAVLLSEASRVKVVSELRCVDFVIVACDEDRTVCKTLSQLPHADVFTNGGDQFNESIPEADICAKLEIELVDGLGKKIESSSDIVKRAKSIPSPRKQE